MKIDNCIILHFPAYAGGKFIGNCMGLSKHCMISDKKSIGVLLKNPEDYDYRLDMVLSTLPEKKDMHKWVTHFEFGELIQHNQFSENDTNIDIIHDLFNSDSKFTITAHSLHGVENILMVCGKATVISLVNYTDFQTISYSKKGTRLIDNANETIAKYNILRGDSWPTWSEFESHGYNIKKIKNTYTDNIINEVCEFYPAVSDISFDIDSCIFIRDKFLNNIEHLYSKIKFDDFDIKLVGEYYDRYIELHK